VKEGQRRCVKKKKNCKNAGECGKVTGCPPSMIRRRLEAKREKAAKSQGPQGKEREAGMSQKAIKAHAMQVDWGKGEIETKKWLSERGCLVKRNREPVASSVAVKRFVVGQTAQAENEKV